eukprot:PRCOL_00004589-RA
MLGALARLGMGRAFGPVIAGVTAPAGSALFTDLPANTVACFLYGLLVSGDAAANATRADDVAPRRLRVALDDFSEEGGEEGAAPPPPPPARPHAARRKPLAALPHGHPLQDRAHLHDAIRVAVCGAFSTYSGFNQAVVALFAGGTTWLAACTAIVLQMTTALAALSAGVHLAWALSEHHDFAHIAEPKQQAGEEGGGAAIDLLDAAFIALALGSLAAATAGVVVDTAPEHQYRREWWVALLLAPVGVAVRRVLSAELNRPGWPWGTFAANMLGSLINAVDAALDSRIHSVGSDLAFKGIALGLDGGLSTVSSWAGEMHAMLVPRHGHGAARAYGYAATTILSGQGGGAVAVAVAPDEDALPACTGALERALGEACVVVGVLAAEPHPRASAPRERSSSAVEVPLERLPGRPNAFVLRAPPAAAATAACAPNGGLAAALGLRPALCVCGPWREPALGADAPGGGAHEAARAAALAGVPAVAACVPATGAGVPLDGIAEAIEVASAHAARLLAAAGSPAHGGAANWPRAHFPFPTRGRWADVGGAQLPCDAELTRSLGADAAAGSDGFAAADCWSLGGAAALSVPTEEEVRAAALSPAERRAVLAQAFRDGDVYVALHAPARWRASAGGRFAPARPGVLWHQEQDLFGRSLPLQTVGGASAPTSDGATFVPQLNAAQVLADAREGRAGRGAVADRPLPTAFRVGAGTLLVDASARGDVDAVLAGRCAVGACQTWPHGHALSLLDSVMTEALREAGAADDQGMPAWLTEHAGGSAARRGRHSTS